LFEAWRLADGDDELDRLVSGRMERQSIFEHSGPPTLWVILDEGVLHRRIGSGKIMHDQLAHLANMSERSKITIQVIPAEVGAHVGLLGATPSVVAKLSEIFDTLRAEALARGASRDLIRRVAEERWT
jgi:hypothetical protein